MGRLCFCTMPHKALAVNAELFGPGTQLTPPAPTTALIIHAFIEANLRSLLQVNTCKLCDPLDLSTPNQIHRGFIGKLWFIPY